MMFKEYGSIPTFSVTSADDSVRAVSAVAVASICWRGTGEGRQGLARVFVIEGKVSAAAAAIDCSMIGQHLVSVFGIQRALSSAWMMGAGWYLQAANHRGTPSSRMTSPMSRRELNVECQAQR